MLHEACRVLKPGGRLAVIHWVHDAATPRGPDLAIRPRPDQCRRWLEDAGCEILIRLAALPPWHFGVVGVRRCGELLAGHGVARRADDRDELPNELRWEDE